MTDRRLEVLDTIQADMKKDAERFDGQPFTGKTMAEYNGYQGAAISSLAEILVTVMKELKKLKESNET